MKQKVLLVVFALGMCGISANTQTRQSVRKNTSSAKTLNKNSREYKIEHDGFEWYLICKNGKYGAESRNGSIIIPTEYTDVRYCTQGDYEYFNVKMGGYDGIYDLNGKCIIPYTRHYKFDWVLKCNEEGLGTYYRLCKWKIEGDTHIKLCEVICDAKGKEILNMQGKDIMAYPSIQNKLYFYFNLRLGNKKGIANANGDILVDFTPMDKNEYIYYDCENGYFYSRVNDSKKILAKVSPERLKDNPFKDNITTMSSNSSHHSSFSNNSNSSNSNSSNNNSGNKTTTVVVEHHRDPVPVQEWVQCTTCWGSGTCPDCAGSGTKYIGDNLRRCWRCGGRGKCSSCSGQGGRYYTVYK